MVAAFASVITNLDYLPGLLTLEYSLRKSQSKYKLIALCTNDFPAKGLSALKQRSIDHRTIQRLSPKTAKNYAADPRFNECWTKLQAFGLFEYAKVVLLDCDMLIRENIDNLMDIDLDAVKSQGKGSRLFAAAHACVCNPLHKPHYPVEWNPQNCAYTSQHDQADDAQIRAALPTTGLGLLNSGTLVIQPCEGVYEQILQGLQTEQLDKYTFPDQDLLADIFRKQWYALPYVYNALKPMRRQGVHDKVWRDEKVKIIHYILSPKPWDQEEDLDKDDILIKWWRDAIVDRQNEYRVQGINDGY